MRRWRGAMPGVDVGIAARSFALTEAELHRRLDRLKRRWTQEAVGGIENSHEAVTTVSALNAFELPMAGATTLPKTQVTTVEKKSLADK